MGLPGLSCKSGILANSNVYAISGKVKWTKINEYITDWKDKKYD